LCAGISPAAQVRPAETAVASPVACGEAVIRLIRLLGAGAGLVIVLEDLHWADNRGYWGHRSCRR
jgi:predicted ATPase